MQKDKTELMKLWKCNALIEAVRGTVISQTLAKQIYELQKGYYKVTEQRLDDSHTLVSMQIIEDEELVDSQIYFFIVHGKLGNKLNFSE